MDESPVRHGGRVHLHQGPTRTPPGFTCRGETPKRVAELTPSSIPSLQRHPHFSCKEIRPRRAWQLKCPSQTGPRIRLSLRTCSRQEGCTRPFPRGLATAESYNRPPGRVAGCKRSWSSQSSNTRATRVGARADTTCDDHMLRERCFGSHLNPLRAPQEVWTDGDSPRSRGADPLGRHRLGQCSPTLCS